MTKRPVPSAPCVRPGGRRGFRGLTLFGEPARLPAHEAPPPGQTEQNGSRTRSNQMLAASSRIEL